MVCLTREEILSAALELKVVQITIKEWGGKFSIREFSGTEYDAWEQAVVADRGNLRAITVVHALRYENDARVFQDQDIAIVASKPARILDRIANRARSLNRLGGDDVENEKGNSEPGQVAPSSST
jgi:hypothetical protein